jgi:hypothetical protein
MIKVKVYAVDEMGAPCYVCTATDDEPIALPAGRYSLKIYDGSQPARTVAMVLDSVERQLDELKKRVSNAELHPSSVALGRQGEHLAQLQERVQLHDTRLTKCEGYAEDLYDRVAKVRKSWLASSSTNPELVTRLRTMAVFVGGRPGSMEHKLAELLYDAAAAVENGSTKKQE